MAGDAAARPVNLPEEADEREAFLGRFASLNSFSAARLASLDLPLQRLLALPAHQRAQLPSLLPDVPARALALFWVQAAARTPGGAGVSSTIEGSLGGGSMHARHA